ncbi:MAG TPA: ATPase domain-containing protein [Nitrospiraceae bacterium]|nr:ATPase domain-containing protein [Nitrospiraceae bacterium]
MNEDGKATIRRFPTGVPGLDDVLGGGLHEFSFNLVAGSPGCGKTTLVHQIAFANATPERPALYLSILGEPPLKMLRYQQTYAFFDPAKVNHSIRFLYLTQEVMNGGLKGVLDKIVHEVETTAPGLVIVDSFRAVVRATASGKASELELQDFVQRLALHLTAWEATTFLVGEFQDNEKEANPVFTLADSMLWLYQSVERNSVVRKLQVMKMRGQAPIPGQHTFRITSAGLQVFPRLPKPEEARTEQPQDRRLSIGVRAVDDMLGGGIPLGYSLLIAGPSGSGKTVLSTQFIIEGVKQGEPGVIAVFEKRPQQYLSTTPSGESMDQMVRDGRLQIVAMRPLDLSVDEALYELRDTVLQIGAKRVVVDSLSGFELALAPPFREDFRESLYRMVGALTGMGVTVILTAEMVDSYIDLKFSAQGASFLVDGIILQRYIEMQGRLTRVMTVIKLRASDHSKEIRTYDITEDGLVLGKALTDYREILMGVPKPIAPPGALAE